MTYFQIHSGCLTDTSPRPAKPTDMVIHGSTKSHYRLERREDPGGFLFFFFWEPPTLGELQEVEAKRSTEEVACKDHPSLLRGEWNSDIIDGDNKLSRPEGECLSFFRSIDSTIMP